MNPFDRRIYIEVIMRVPGERDPRRIAIALDLDFHNCLMPLSPNHDFSLDAVAVREGTKQIKERWELIPELANELAKALTKLIYSKDPKNGYSPEELS